MGSQGFVERRKRKTVTIAVSADDTGAFYLPAGYSLCGLELPAAFDTNTARLVILATGSYDGSSGTVNQPKDYGGTAVDESSITVAATNTNRIVNLTPSKWNMYDRFTIGAFQSDGTTPVVQTTARDIVLLLTPSIS